MSERDLSSFISTKIFDSWSAATSQQEVSLTTTQGGSKSDLGKKTQQQRVSKKTYIKSDGVSRRLERVVSTIGHKSFSSTKSTYNETLTGIAGTDSKKQSKRSTKSIGFPADIVIMSIYEKGKDINTRIGISVINYVTGELTLTEYSDSQLFIRTINKIILNDPTDIIFPSSSVSPILSRLARILKINLSDQVKIHIGPLKIYDEKISDVFLKSHSILNRQKLTVLLEELSDKTFAMCSLSALVAFIENNENMKTPLSNGKKTHSLAESQKFRTKYEPIENILLINPSTIKNLELVASQSKTESVTLLSFLNKTCTKMGYRYLKNSILQPFSKEEPIKDRFDAVEELMKLNIVQNLRNELKKLPDLDLLFSKLLTADKVTTKPGQLVNFVLLLKESFQNMQNIKILMISNKFESKILNEISNIFNLFDIDSLTKIIECYLESDCRWAKNNQELQNQKIYAIKKGQNGLLDTLREIYSKLVDEILDYVKIFSKENHIKADATFQSGIGFFISVHESKFRTINLSNLEVVNKIMKKTTVEFTTKQLTISNIKLLSIIKQIESICEKLLIEVIFVVTKSLEQLFILTESCSLLDLLCCFATNAIENHYCIPKISDKLLVLNSRHPILEKTLKCFIPNDISSTFDTSRLQIITGTNMTGKSVYLKQIILLCLMSHMGCPVPADSACFPIYKSMHARLCSDNIDFTCSSFTTEMKEISYMIDCLEKQSLMIIDELGRGTSVVDGLSISLSMIDYLSNFNSTVYISTHFKVIPEILQLNPFIRNIKMSYSLNEANKIIKDYKAIINRNPEKAENSGILSIQDFFDSELINGSLLLCEQIDKISQYGILTSRLHGKNEKEVGKVQEIKKVLNMVNTLKELYKHEANIDINLILNLQNEFLKSLTNEN